TEDTVKGIDRDMVMGYLAQQYVPNNVLISVAGNIVHEEVVAAIKGALGDWPSAKPAAWIPAISSNGVRCAVKYKSTEQAPLSVVLAELGRLREDGPTTEELTKARELSKGRLMLRMEDTRNVSGWIGGQELLMGNVRSIEEAVAEMDAVTLEDLQRVAREIIDPSKLHLAVVGPYRSDKKFAALLPA